MTTPRIIHLMRHGEPEGAGRLIGHSNPPATPAGIAACVTAARPLAVSAIVSSDLARADACARAIASPQAITVRQDPRWRELDFGAWDGMYPTTIVPERLTQFWQDPDHAPPPDGERWSALVDRVTAALPMLADRTLVLTHAGAIRAALATLCGFDGRQIWAFDLPYAAIVTLRLWPSDPPNAQITGLTA